MQVGISNNVGFRGSVYSKIVETPIKFSAEELHRQMIIKLLRLPQNTSLEQAEKAIAQKLTQTIAANGSRVG